MIMKRNISKLALVLSQQHHCKFLSIGALLQGKALPLNVHARCLAPDINTSAVIRLLCMSSPKFSVFTLWQKIWTTTTTKKCPEQLSPLHLHIRESCCDKLCRWLHRAIRQHTVCLTKCFLSDTLELSWLLAAWFRVFIWAALWGSASISAGFGFCHHCDPTAEDTWCDAADGVAAAGLHIHPDGAMLDLSGGPLPCPPSIRRRPFCVTFWHICWHVSFGNRC